jgi:preprotein translocase subunit YajC
MDATDILIQSALVLALCSILYMALVRPQQRRLQQHKLMLAGLEPGDRVVTSGGLVGTIVGVDNERTVMVEIVDNIRVSIIRDRIDEVLLKAERRNAPRLRSIGG